jgi:Leucine-rich repeat (LRR) protein
MEHWLLNQFFAIYQGLCMDITEKQALSDLETLLKEPILIVSLLDSFKFGFIPISNHVARLGIPRKDLVTLPDSFCKLTSLQELSLFGNRLATLPDAFGDLKSLRFLNLVQNNLTTLPPSFSKLASLQILYLNENQLQIIPTDFGDLVALKRLNLRNNKLESLPSSFSELANLELLWIENNPLDEVAKRVLRSLMDRGVTIDIAPQL